MKACNVFENHITAQIQHLDCRSHSTSIDSAFENMGPMPQDSEQANDRRALQRFSLSVPLTVIAGHREIQAYTRDLSNRGVYFYLTSDDSDLIEHDFEFTVELPPEITFSTSCRVRCQGRAVRKEEAWMGLTGVAAQILDYSIFREGVSVA